LSAIRGVLVSVTLLSGAAVSREAAMFSGAAQFDSDYSVEDDASPLFLSR
jgi:hypothetical protein